MSPRKWKKGSRAYRVHRHEPHPDPEKRIPQPVAKVGEEQRRAPGHDRHVLGDEQPGRRSLVVAGIKLARRKGLVVVVVVVGVWGQGERREREKRERERGGV